MCIRDRLKALGRIHTWEEFLESFRLAREAGFSNLNVDLMSALPGQTVESWMDTLKKTADLDPEHISAYSLIIEEGTPFFEAYGDGRGDGILPDEDAEREMYHRTREFLKDREMCIRDRIYLKGLRYNQHVRARSALIEVGAQTNTYEEARNAMEPLAHILDQVLRGS